MARKESSYQKLKRKNAELREEVQDALGNNGWEAYSKVRMKYRLLADCEKLWFTGGPDLTISEALKLSRPRYVMGIDPASPDAKPPVAVVMGGIYPKMIEAGTYLENDKTKVIVNSDMIQAVNHDAPVKIKKETKWGCLKVALAFILMLAGIAALILFMSFFTNT